jgi:hypothetical protein
VTALHDGARNQLPTSIDVRPFTIILLRPIGK